MWKHEIISDLHKQLEPACRYDPQFKRLLAVQVLPLLEVSQCIHYDDGTSLFEESLKLQKEERPVFIEPDGAMTPMPFNSVLFSFRWEEMKFSMLVEQNIHKGIFSAFLFHFFNAPYKVWCLSPIAFFHKNGRERVAHLNPHQPGCPIEDSELQIKTLVAHLRTVHSLVNVLNARNVYLEPVEPPEKLNRKRIKNGKLPVYRHHVLKVCLSAVKKASTHIAMETVLGAVPVHLCRGHFRDVAESRPLFGRHGCHGRFWIQPHVRGNKKNGVLAKDYELIS